MGKSGGAFEDVYKRINFLYQAAYHSLKLKNFSMCRFYIYTLRTITRRQVLHLHPDMKRNMCKRCCVLLVPGVTSKVRTRSKRQKHTVVSCLDCGTVKRYIYKPGVTPWCDRDGSWQDQIVNGQMVMQNKKQKNKNNCNLTDSKGVAGIRPKTQVVPETKSAPSGSSTNSSSLSAGVT